jgi:hypothetical protein
MDLLFGNAGDAIVRNPQGFRKPMGTKAHSENHGKRKNQTTKMGVIMETNHEYERYQKAKKQVEDIKGFYGHLASYVLVMGLLIFINLRYSPQYLWFVWSMLGWGIGLFFHAMKVFNWFPFFNKEWEEKKIKQYMEQEKKSNKFE